MVKCIEEYVQVDDFKMYTKVFQGKKRQPVIIMESGYGDYSKAWDYIAESIFANHVSRISRSLL